MCGWTPPVFELHGSQSIPGPLVSPGMFMQLYKKHTSWLNCYLCWWSLLLWRPPHFTKNAGYSEAAVGPHFWTWSHRHNYRHRIWPQVQTISPYQERIMLRVGSTRQLHQAARSVIWTCVQSWLAVRPHRGSRVQSTPKIHIVNQK